MMLTHGLKDKDLARFAPFTSTVVARMSAAEVEAVEGAVQWGALPPIARRLQSTGILVTWITTSLR